MTKKNKVTIEESTTSLPQEDLVLHTDVVEKVDPIADKVRNFRLQGFDDNRIAALLRINVRTIKEIK